MINEEYLTPPRNDTNEVSEPENIKEAHAKAKEPQSRIVGDDFASKKKLSFS